MDFSDIGVVLVAAGRGVRAGGDGPKQYRALTGQPVLSRTIAAFESALPDARILCVIHADDRDLYEAALARSGAASRVLPPVVGGASRQESVLAGLRALDAGRTRIVLIHDAARPFASASLIHAAVAAARAHGAAVPALAPVDALKGVDAQDHLLGDIDRNSVRAVQTPQAFALDLIKAAHEKAAAQGFSNAADDAAVAAFAGHRVHTFDGDAANVKLTHPQDFASAEMRLLMGLPDVRTGLGYDVHAFGPGDHIWLGGVRIAHDAALVGHSDADVLLHALTDAILGAIADGDIGAHFPPSDMRWKGAASDVFLKDAAARVAALGGIIAHLDATIICEAPKVGPHREVIRARVAEIAGLEIGRVAVKATTSERLGFTGRREGIAVQAIATVRLPMGGV
ncbi:MAG: bifunctional 2-C-methyl-D-erythritol 4-phosphate cytidylyltransferase/2-C-methyl-D-erythritol 2,4-cyclodiphosphate synthase [Beijerinckiaceae bacterium]|nr:bifunctional 2-C-methyl-D-erythritol 4-phosphate cytidylyltransferase/2-C-methyl-D-erythritol 2,4-cyclodiphosphate synthase [Beijerinckiaceae bacterium]